jgi:hypothetical protein
MTAGACSSRARRHVSRTWLFAALLALLPLGLLIGFYMGKAEQASLTSQQLWRGILLRSLSSTLPSLALTWAATVFVRMTPNRRLWQPAALLVLPVMATHYARAYHPLLIALAECSWFLAALTCAKRKRTLALWFVVTCGACVTGIQLTSELAKSLSQ